MDGDGGLRFGRGRGRPWGRVARGFLRSKVKSSEWSNFGGERLLGAANGDRPKRRIQESKSNPIDGGACSLRLRAAIRPTAGGRSYAIRPSRWRMIPCAEPRGSSEAGAMPSDQPGGV